MSHMLHTDASSNLVLFIFLALFGVEINVYHVLMSNPVNFMFPCGL